MSKNIIVLLGAPCSGKGTIAQKLILKMPDYTHLSIGDALRNKYPIGSEMRNYIDNGNMVSNDIIVDILKSYNNANIILDGFPRTVSQAPILMKLQDQIKAVIVIDVEKDILIERMQNRVICNICGLEQHSNCNGQFIKRIDDNIETYEKRYNLYINNIQAILDYIAVLPIYHIQNNNINIDVLVNNIIEMINVS